MKLSSIKPDLIVSSSTHNFKLLLVLFSIALVSGEDPGEAEPVPAPPKDVEGGGNSKGGGGGEKMQTAIYCMRNKGYVSRKIPGFWETKVCCKKHGGKCIMFPAVKENQRQAWCVLNTKEEIQKVAVCCNNKSVVFSVHADLDLGPCHGGGGDKRGENDSSEKKAAFHAQPKDEENK